MVHVVDYYPTGNQIGSLLKLLRSYSNLVNRAVDGRQVFALRGTTKSSGDISLVNMTFSSSVRHTLTDVRTWISGTPSGL